MSAWKSELLDRLVVSQGADGGWAYRSGQTGAPEPTAWACVGLSAHAHHGEALRKGVSFLRERQEPDGRVLAVREIGTTGWPTPLAALAWRAAEAAGIPGFAVVADQATSWLLNEQGKTFASDPTVYGHDTQLVGWPWIAGTHTWIEPTAYALLALRAAGRTAHARFVDGVRVLRDRAIPSSGWNYGNPRMFGADLRPFPETTGMALAALAGGDRDARIDRGVAYLTQALSSSRSAIAISWAMIGLDAWGQRPADADVALAQAASELRGDDFAPLKASLLLIATEEPCTLNRICSTENTAIGIRS